MRFDWGRLEQFAQRNRVLHVREPWTSALRYRGDVNLECLTRPTKSQGLIALESLELILVLNRFLPLNTIAAIFNPNSTIFISPRRVCRYTHIIGFHNRVAVRKPFIREANLLRKTPWALRHCHCNIFMWSRVVFTDEISFEVRLMKRNMCVWRMNGERFDNSCIIPTYKSCYELVNV